MKCPYCNNEMEIGTIQDPHEISWIKGTERQYIMKASLYEGSVVLSKFSLRHGSAALAHLCRECQKVIIDYADNACDLNAQ